VKETVSKKKTQAKGKTTPKCKTPPPPPPGPKLAYILPGTLYTVKTDKNGDNLITILVDKSQAHRLDGIQRRVTESFVGVLFEPVDPGKVDNMVENLPWGGLEGAG